MTVRGMKPTRQQRAYLARGLDQPGGKLPLHDDKGQRISERVIRNCIDAGWAEVWQRNPIMPDWLVCRLTERGREALRK